MTRWWLVVALLLSLGVNVGVLATLAVQRLREPPAVALPEPEPSRAPSPEQLQHLGRRLAVEGAELERFVALHQDFLSSSRATRERLWELRREVRGRLAGPEPEMAELEPVLREMAATYLELERDLAAHVLVAREMLDGESERRYVEYISRLGAPRGRPMTRPGETRPFGQGERRQGERRPGERSQWQEPGAEGEPPPGRRPRRAPQP